MIRDFIIHLLGGLTTKDAIRISDRNLHKKYTQGWLDGNEFGKNYAYNSVYQYMKDLNGKEQSEWTELVWKFVKERVEK